MGPKAAAKAGKGKKETDEEREAREKEERKQAELEAKKAAIEAEKRRQEGLKLQAARVAAREAELQRLTEEFIMLEDKRKSQLHQRLAEEAKNTAQTEWEKYIDPVDVADPRNEKELNSFVTLTSEEQTLQLKDCIVVVKKIEDLTEHVEEVWSEAVAKNDTYLQTLTRNYLGIFKDMIINKLDAFTANYLRFGDSHMNDKQEIFLEEAFNRVQMGLWGSLSDQRPARKRIEFEKLGIQMDVPKQVLQQDAKFCNRIVRMPIDDVSLRAYEDLSSSSKYVLGDLLYFDLLYPPPQAYTLVAKRWLIRDKSDTYSTVKRCETYPSSVAYKVFVKVPETFVMSDDVRMMMWDKSKFEWTEDGISEYMYSESTRTTQFYLTAVGILALVRTRVQDFPYKQWSLRVLNSASYDDVKNYQKQARFTVQTARFEVVIDIQGSHCKLVKPQSSVFASLVGKGMAPGKLLYLLQQRGVNVLPTQKDISLLMSSDDSSVKEKNREIEAIVVRDMARCSSSLEFASSSWNNQLSQNQIGILTRESTIYTGGSDTYDYECVLCEMDSVSDSYKGAPEVGECPQLCTYLMVVGNNYGNAKGFLNTARPGQQSHLALADTVAGRITSEAKERVEGVNETFQQTVLTLLQLIRPYSLTVA